MAGTTVVPSVVSGSDLVELDERHVGEKYVLGAMVPKDNAAWRGPWDCAEFASWIVFQTAALLYGCDRDFGNPATADAYTGYWERDARTLGHIISLEEAARTPGAAVLRIPQGGATGHIVMSQGDGKTIEAHSSKDGVVELALSGRRWDMGVLIPGITYGANPPVAVEPPKEMICRLTAPPQHGEAVRRIQQGLKAVGFDPGAIDGEFGPHTQAAVIAFQLSQGLVADGEVGAATIAALMS